MTIKEAKNKVVSLARSEVGYREGGDNFTKYASDQNISKLYGWTPQNQPWCGTFVNWVFMTALGYDLGSKLTYGGSALCRAAADNYKAHNAFNKSPELGDQSFYYSGGAINHTGIVVEVNGDSFVAVEGNYSDKVSLVTHSTGSSDVAGFGRPCWDIVLSASAQSQGKNESISAQSQGKTEVDIADHEWEPLTLSTSNVYKADCVVLQALLNVHHFACGQADGFFGPKTQAAVNKLQAWAKIKVDGVCGPETWKVLLTTKR